MSPPLMERGPHVSPGESCRVVAGGERCTWPCACVVCSVPWPGRSDRAHAGRGVDPARQAPSETRGRPVCRAPSHVSAHSHPARLLLIAPFRKKRSVIIIRTPSILIKKI